MDIVVDKLSVRNEEENVLEEITFKARPGKVFGILGPPGAGKTILIQTILGFIRPEQGTVEFGGQAFSGKIRDRIGYLPEKRGIYQSQRLIDVLIYFGRLKNLSPKKARIEAIRLLDRFGMIEVMEKTLAPLSKELQEKLQILITIIHNPDTLVLEEPFRNLHPLNKDLLRKLVYRFREEEKTIIISTSQFSEAEKLCDDILFLNQGRMLLKGNLDKLRQNFQAHIISVEADDNLAALKEIKGVKRFFTDKQSAKLFVDYSLSPKETLQKIISTVNVNRIEISRPNLDDIFFVVLNKAEAK